MKKSNSALALTSICLLVISLNSCDPPAKPVTENGIDGVYEYLPPLKGQSIVRNGRYVFLYGPSDGSGPMTGEAGTHVVSGDTVKTLITYCTDSTKLGAGYWWRIKSTSGDTTTFEVLSDGQIISGSSIRISN